MKVKIANLLLTIISLLLASQTYAFQNQALVNIGSEKNIRKTIRKLEKGAMVIAFDESGQMIQFPKQVIKRNQVVVFKVRVSKSSFADKINNFFKRIDSTHNYFLNFPENQLVLWSIFGFDEQLVASWLNELGTYRGYRQKFSWPLLYDLSLYNRGLEDNVYKTPASLKYFPIKLFFDHLLDSQFVIKTQNHNLVVNRDITLSPALLKLKSKGDDCYWWYSERLLLDTLLGSNCLDCNSNLPFILIKRDPLQATITEWYNKEFDLACRKPGQDNTEAKNLLVKKLTYLSDANEVLAKMKNMDDASKNIVKMIRQTAEYISDSIGQQNEKIEAIMEGDTILTPQRKQAFVLLIKEVHANEQTQAVSLQIDRNSVLTDSLKKAIADLFHVPIQQYFLKNFTIDELKTINGNSSFDLPEYLMVLREIRCWLFQWLWYNNGFMVVNPLPLKMAPAKEIRESLTVQLKYSTRRLQNLLQQQVFLDSIRVHVKPDIDNLTKFKRVQYSADTIQLQIDSVNKHIAKLKESLDADSKARANADKAQNEAGVTGIQAYSGQIPVLGHKRFYRERWLLPGRLTVLQQFTYSKSRKYIASIYRNERQKAKFSEIPENEKALMVIHNIPLKATISVGHTLTGYNDTEDFTLLFQKLMKGLDSTGVLQMALGSPLTRFSSFLRDFFPTNDVNKLTANIAKVVGQPRSTLLSVDAMTFTYLRNSAINSPVPFSENMKVLKNIEPKIDMTTGYISSFIPMPDSTAPYMVTSTIQIDTIKAKTTLRVGALHRVQLAAGFALVRNPVQQVSVDTTGNDFKTGSASNSSSAILGVKLYPFKTYLRDGGLWPRYPLKRLSMLVALAVPRPLDNFYLGGGYDIVPGLTYTMGINIYKQNYYQVQNASIIKSSSRYTNGGLYYGVTVNPIVFVQFVKLFFN